MNCQKLPGIGSIAKVRRQEGIAGGSLDASFRDFGPPGKVLSRSHSTERVTQPKRGRDCRFPHAIERRLV
jgi:hypothetical protein